ncbi:MAG: FAD-dependent oxidoreductase [Myxococcales bacterium]|nr:MAG: FAD-dependent oxidoreductase [Myxococcales bacterium]
MDWKIGVYICEGCGIGDALDLGRLEKVATGEYKAPVCKRHGGLCRDEGVALIKSDIDSGAVDAAIVAACSPRQMTPRFDFNGALVERVSLREGVVWSHNPETLESDLEEEDAEENVNMLAEDMLRVALVRVQKTQAPNPYLCQPAKRVLVIGGGVTGLSAALDVARAGYEAVLVEKSAELGGWARRFKRNEAPLPPFDRVREPDVNALIEQVKATGTIKAYTSCEVKQVAGQPGEYKVELSDGQTLDIGAVVVAAGWKPFDTAKYADKYALGANPNVITSIEFEERLAKGGKILRADGQPAAAVAFVTNVETKEGDMGPHRGNVADIVALKQAHYLKTLNGEITPYLFHDHVKASGLYEELFRAVQKDGLVLVRGAVTSLAEGSERPIALAGEDILLGAEVEMEVDLVVLSVGMAPTTLDEEVLHLKYRQGPELPALSHGYPNSHFVCFPYETRRTGVYACGAVREPMNLARAAEDAAGAAMKAIGAIELISQGKASLPRVGDLIVPDFSLQRCTQCKRCTEECPFGAIDEDAKGTPQYNPTRCRRCGTCMGACPERIINFPNYSIDMIGSMIKAIHVPDEFEEKPRVLGFVCENDAYPALDMAAQNRLSHSAYIRMLPIRCLGSINLVWIADALAKGFDGVMLLGCKHGDDYQCHFIKGSELANTRMEKVSETLNRLMLESARIGFHEINITDYKAVPGMINTFVASLKDLGPNPYKQ